MANTVALESKAAPPVGKWLRRVRFIWVALIGIIFVTFLYNIPGAYTMLSTVCDVPIDQCASWGQPTPQLLATLTDYLISLRAFAIYHIILFVTVSLIFWGSGLLVLRYRSNNWHGLLVSYLLIAVGAGGVSFVLSPGPPYSDLPIFLDIVSSITIMPLYLALSLFFQTFPDGHMYPRWSLFGTVLILANYAVWLAPDAMNIQNWPPSLSGMWLLLVFGFHVFIQGYRYRYFYAAEQRQQTKWLIFGFAIALFSSTILSYLSRELIDGLLEGTLVATGYYLPIAFGVTIAILKYQLWDIDIIINRTLVYGVLTTILVAIYAVVVGALSSLINNDGNFVISLLGAGVTAVLFQPLRATLQKAINRRMFGHRDEPLKVMIDFGRSLEMIGSPDDAVQHLLATTATTLKLPYVAIQRGNDANTPISHGKRIAELEAFPLIYQAENIGTLLVSARSPGEGLNAVDRLVLENVARQMSNVVHAATLTHDLQQSRQQILTTREEERRRLRRDLHDGLGPAMATLTLQAEAAREWLHKNPERTDALLEEIIVGSQNTLSDIRRIVYALRPPALDDLGLVSAIQEQANQYSRHDLSIKVDAPTTLPPLPAAVEVATYRIVQEALTNVTRHSQAQMCTVSLRVNGSVDIEIVDDGIGIPKKYRAGVGLSAIHERAAELGGSCEINSSSEAGTQITVSLPRE